MFWNPSLCHSACWANITTTYHYTLSLSSGIRPRTQVRSFWKLTVRCSRNRGPTAPRRSSLWQKLLWRTSSPELAQCTPSARRPARYFPAQNLRNYCLSRRLSTGAQTCKITTTVGTRCRTRLAHEDVGKFQRRKCNRHCCGRLNTKFWVWPIRSVKQGKVSLLIHGPGYHRRLYCILESDSFFG